ncbi:GAF domain-containing protein [Antarctobacter heliothermus]|uniref:GAF domain-containing protein n=1 Tax=Antarctobacter heliothermus TaxID=74033 RepID=UPI001482FACB|nr:GAF domain-containing protein [Antarctobacter heliothermus]
MLYCKTLATALSAHVAGIWTLNKATGTLDARLVWDRDTCDSENGTDLTHRTAGRPVDEVDQDQIVAIADTRTDPRWGAPTPEAGSSAELRAVLECPLHTPSGLTGVVSIGNKRAPREWTAREISFAAAVAGLISLARLCCAKAG